MVGGRFVEIHVTNAGAGTAVLGMRRKGARSGVFHVGGGDNAERFALGAGEVVPHVLHAGVIPFVGGVIREDSFLTIV